MIEIIPKPTPKIPFWKNILLYLAIALVVGSILSYFILNNFQKKASATLEDLEARLTKAETVQEITSLEKEVLSYRKKIEDFSKLLNVHQFSSNFFPFIESLTHPQARWSDFNLDMTAFTVSLSAQTENFQTLGQQILILKEEKLIKKINLSNIRLGKEGGVDFQIDFTFDSGILK